MPIRCKCPKCASTLKIKDELAGKKGKCPKCRTPFQIPVPRVRVATGVLDSEEEAYQHLTEELAEPTSPQTSSASTSSTQSSSYFRSEPTAAADLAGELLSQSGKKSQKTDWRAALKKTTKRKKVGVSYNEYVKYYGPKMVTVVACCVIVFGGVYWLVKRSTNAHPDLPPLGLVKGVVTLDGQPLVHAMIEFDPIRVPGEDAPKATSSFGKTDASGLYELTYVKDVYGAAAGKHRVVITASPSSRILLSSKYNYNSKLTAEVKADENNVCNFQLKTRP